MAENLKIGLRKKLLTARQKLEVELKENKEAERKLDALMLKKDNQGLEDIKIPNYATCKQMENLFTEIEQPPESLYKQVGYNDLPQIMKMMEGNDVEKRAAQLRSA